MKILYVSTISNTINAFMIPHIKFLFEQGHQIDIVCNVNKEIDERLLKLGCNVYNVELQRSPLSMKNYYAYRKIKKIIKNGIYDIVHTHTPIASACVRLACKNMGDIKVVYTAHGFHFFKGAPLMNWIFYYPIERYLARYTDVIITINKEDHDRAKRSLKARKIEYIPGVGLDVKRFSNDSIDIKKKRNEIGIPEGAFVIVSVGELNKNKNHETVIKAISKLNNPNVCYVICGKGPLNNHLEKLIIELNLESRVKLLGMRSDINEIYNISDVFVFPSFREGLSVALMEAMASGLPIISSNIRGNNDLVEDQKNGYLINHPTDVNSYVNYIKLIMNFSEEDIGHFAKRNFDKIQFFSTNNVLKKMNLIYESLNK